MFSVTRVCLADALSQSACVITGGSARAATLADALQKAVGALGTELDVIPDLMGENGRCLLKEWNFIQLSVNRSFLSDVEAMLTDLEAANRALLHPLVVIWVRLSDSDELSVSGRAAEPAAIMDLASAAKLRNILLYGIQLHQSKDTERWERSVSRVAEITSALIRERSPALVGQLLQA